MPTSTRSFALCCLTGAVLVAAGCDPCAADPTFCMPGAPDAGTTDASAADPTDDPTDGGSDAAAETGSSAGVEPGADEDDGMLPDGEGETGGAGGSGGGEGESGESGGESGDPEPDVGDALACWAGFDACLNSGAPEIDCFVDLRVCIADAGFDLPDGDCLDEVAGCLERGGNLLDCVEGGAECAGDGVRPPWSDACEAGHAFCLKTTGDADTCDALLRACEDPTTDPHALCDDAHALCLESGQPAFVCDALYDLCAM
jgi:hypothetical protein